MSEAAPSVFRPGDSVSASVGEEFLISLQEPGASGYLFEPVLPTDFVSLVCAIRQGSTTPGASGTALFRLKAEKVGEGELAFELRAPWEDEAASRISLPFFIRP